MLRSIRGQFDQATSQLSALFPDGPRVAVIGSTDFWHDESERTCTEIGRLLATIHSLLLITGGVEGIGEATGRSFYETRRKLGNEPRIYHVLPEGEEGWDYGETFFVGADMAERREVLARLADLYVAIEGGPGTVHEVAVASGRGALVIPVGRSGGHAKVVYGQMTCPQVTDEQTWTVLGSAKSTPEETAKAVCRIVELFTSSVRL